MDDLAASELVRYETLWLIGDCKWDLDLTIKAVVWLSQKVSKPILKLTDRNYNDNGIADFLEDKGAYDIN